MSISFNTRLKIPLVNLGLCVGYWVAVKLGAPPRDTAILFAYVASMYSLLLVLTEIGNKLERIEDLLETKRRDDGNLSAV